MAPALLPEIVAESVSPVVMVISTPLAEAACRKNALSFVDLLRPFCTLNSINVPVRTASDTPYRLQEFRIRLAYASEMQPVPLQAAEERLLDLVTDASDNALAELKGDPRQLETLQKMVQSESMSSWFQQYSREFVKTLCFSDHESLDHPVACLLVASSIEENLLDTLLELSNVDNLPSMIKDEIMDPKVLKHYVVLHDKQIGLPEFDRVNEIFQHLRGTYGSIDCSLLSINSGDPSNLATGDFWTSNTSKTGEGETIGSCLQDCDLDEIQGFVIDICQKHIIPYMEQKVRVLNQQVAATRKGLRNQIKNLWWRKKDEITEASAVYTVNSMESQIRVLADYAFMLRDYELAVSNYRLLSSDYKADKAMKRYAGVMEMIGLCLCLLDQSRREADAALETAYTTYQMCGPVASRYATRSALWWSEVHKYRSQYREAASVLFRAATEMDKEATLRAGILLEQSAYCYLRCNPPMLRKFGFHLVLAGVRYHLSGQRKHAIRVYTSVLPVYDGQGWSYINDHVNLYLGRISSFLGDLDAAVQYFMNLVTSSRQSAATQAIFLSEFLGSVQKSSVKDEILYLSLPTVNAKSLHVRYEDHRTYASSVPASLSEDDWLQLETGLVPSTAGSVGTWLDGLKGQKQTDLKSCVAGEEVIVSFEVHNPLQVPIDISSMELICDIEMEEVNGVPGGNLVLSKESFSLRRAEKTEVKLNVKPLVEGILKVVGVKWVVSGTVLCRYDFPAQAKKEKRGKTKGAEELVQGLMFRVVTQVPRLDVSVHELPPRVNAGEVRRLVLEIQNSSHASVKNLKLRTSHPGLLMVGKQGDLDLEFPNCLEVSSNQKKDEPYDTSDEIFSFPKEVTLEGASTLLWPLWLSARRPGDFELKTVLYFEPDQQEAKLKYRTVRLINSVQVAPSLQISVTVSPCPTELNMYLMRLDVFNMHQTESFWLRQVSCISDSWGFSTVQPQLMDGGDGDAAYLSALVSPTQLLPPLQSSSFFFQMQKKSVPEFDDSEGCCYSFGLAPAGSKEPLIDLSYGPLLFFHQQERQLQKSSEGRGESVDVILISEQQDDMAPDKPVALQNNFRFGTHHLCHCRVPTLYPLAWVLHGPRRVQHNFVEQPLCEIELSLELLNCSTMPAAVTVETIDPGSSDAALSSSPAWRCASPPPSLNSSSSAAAAEAVVAEGSSSSSSSSSNSVLLPRGPYIWSGTRSVTSVHLQAGASARVQLAVSVSNAGVFDVCSYRVSWSLQQQQQTQQVDSSSAPVPAAGLVRRRFEAAPATVCDTSSWLHHSAAAAAVASDGTASEKKVGETTRSYGFGHPFLLAVGCS